MLLTKISVGLYKVVYPSDEREDAKIKIGDEVKMSHARNADFHRKAFALLNLMFENQDGYKNIEPFRQVITIRAGFAEIAPDENGEMRAFADSWSFEKMPQEKFEKLYKSLLDIAAFDLKTSKKEIQSQLMGFY